MNQVSQLRGMRSAYADRRRKSIYANTPRVKWKSKSRNVA